MAAGPELGPEPGPERVAEMYDVSYDTPYLHSDVQNKVHGMMFLQDVASFRRIADERLRFNNAIDRRLMTKYQEIEKYHEYAERLKIIPPPQESHKVDLLLNFINNKRKNVTLESVIYYDRILEVAAEFYSPKVMPKFGQNTTSLEKILADPIANHTLRRTYYPTLESFFGVDIKVPIKYQLARRQEEETQEDIPHALQGEIAGLNQKFNISLDPTASYKSIRLMCRLDDDLLPSVPPIYLEIPENYPFSSPKCILMQHDYSATPFLLSVQKNLTGSILKLPKCYSVTHVLSSWEMSVRKAFHFANSTVDSFSMIYEMLIQ